MRLEKAARRSSTIAWAFAFASGSAPLVRVTPRFHRGDEALFQCTKPSGVPRVPSHLQFPWLLRATMRSPLRSPAQVEGTQGFLPQPGKDFERPSSTRLEARFPYHGSGAMTRSPSPLAWRPDEIGRASCRERV